VREGPKSLEGFCQGFSKNLGRAPDLDARLLAAHGRGDLAALVTLYTEAADTAEETDAEMFYLTHALVYALDLGDVRAGALWARLRTARRI